MASCIYVFVYSFCVFHSQNKTPLTKKRYRDDAPRALLPELASAHITGTFPRCQINVRQMSDSFFRNICRECYLCHPKKKDITNYSE
mgnify:CR=1 FL=1